MKYSQDEMYKVFDLIYEDDAEGLKQLARKGLENATDESGDSALLYTVQQNKLNLTKILLDNGADPSVTTYLGDNCLHLGAKWGNIDLVKLFLEYDIDIDAKGQDGFTAINYAVWFNDSDEVAQALYSAGASIDIPDDEFNLTARECALRKNIKFRNANDDGENKVRQS